MNVADLEDAKPIQGCGPPRQGDLHAAQSRWAQRRAHPRRARHQGNSDRGQGAEGCRGGLGLRGVGGHRGFAQEPDHRVRHPEQYQQQKQETHPQGRGPGDETRPAWREQALRQGRQCDTGGQGNEPTQQETTPGIWDPWIQDEPLGQISVNRHEQQRGQAENRRDQQKSTHRAMIPRRADFAALPGGAGPGFKRRISLPRGAGARIAPCQRPWRRHPRAGQRRSSRRPSGRRPCSASPISFPTG